MKTGHDPYQDDDTVDDPNSREKVECGVAAAATDWCDDDYHGGGGRRGNGDDGKQPPNTMKTYEDQKRILWLDAPGARPLPKAGLPFKVEAKFEAKVSGDLGTCECSFDLLIEVNAARKVVKNEITNINCTP